MDDKSISAENLRSVLESQASIGMVAMSQSLNLTPESLLQSILDQIAMGRLSRLHLYFSWSEDQRSVMQSSRRLTDDGYKRTELTSREHQIFHAFRRTNIFQSEIYSLISSIELGLHEYIKLVLKTSFGEENWWDGVPQKVRTKCAARAEEERSENSAIIYPHSLYNMTTLTELWEIIDKNYSKFESASQAFESPKINKKTLDNKGLFRQNFNCLIRYRNATMHPIKLVRFRYQDFQWVCERLTEFSIDPFNSQTNDDFHDRILVYLSEHQGIKASDMWALAEVMTFMSRRWQEDSSVDSKPLAINHLIKLGVSEGHAEEFFQEALRIWTDIYYD